MSEKKSWDIQPKPRTQPSPAAPARVIPPTQRAVSVRSASPARQARPVQQRQLKPQPAPQARKKPIVTTRPERVLQGKDREPLRARRRRAQARARVVLIIILVLLIVAAFASLWLPALRVQSVTAIGPDAQGAEAIAQGQITGTLDYILPKDSIFFFPQNSIRSAILKTYPEVSAVSISRTSLSTISLADTPRVEAFVWCGQTYGADEPSTKPIASALASTTDATASSTPATITPPIPTCYEADGQGFIFATTAAPTDTATLLVYGPLATASTSAIGSKVTNASAIPAALQFVKAVEQLDVPVMALAIRRDEADIYAKSGTRITYVLGREQTAADLAQSSFSSLSINDGSLEYIDLRFDGKSIFHEKRS